MNKSFDWVVNKRNLETHWRAFKLRLRTKQQVHDAMYEILVRLDVLRCSCSNVHFKRTLDSREIQCMRCKRRSSFTAGTFFSHVRAPRLWLFIMWLAEQGIPMNSNQLHEVTGFAQSSINVVIQRVCLALEHWTGHAAELVCARAMNPVIVRRTRLTPAEAPPTAELDVMETRDTKGAGASQSQFSESAADRSDRASDRASDGASVGASVGADFCSEENKILAVISQRTTHIDDLLERSGMSEGEVWVELLDLELSGKIVRLPGSRYSLAAEQSPADTAKESLYLNLSAAVINSVATATAFLKCVFRGVSAKYLQIYLSAYRCCVSRDGWVAGSVSEACVSFGPISYEKIMKYVSPYYLKVPHLMAST